MAQALSEAIRSARADAEAEGEDPDAAAEMAIDNYCPDVAADYLHSIVQLIKRTDAERDAMAAGVGEDRADVDAFIERQARWATEIDHENNYSEGATESFWAAFAGAYGEESFWEAFTRNYGRYDEYLARLVPAEIRPPTGGRPATGS
jgi:hypothetical protein